MRPNKLREKLNAGEPTLGTHIHTTWPSIVEALGHTGEYDYVEFVAEYGPLTCTTWTTSPEPPSYGTWER